VLEHRVGQAAGVERGRQGEERRVAAGVVVQRGPHEVSVHPQVDDRPE
jgi:hypothetical protein